MKHVDAGKRLRFWQVDSFSQERYMGNPAAVVFAADSLSGEEMQTIARQMNLSETVFLCQPSAEADYRARIFTPTREIPFAGHPTIAAAFAHVMSHAGADRVGHRVVRQECGAGLIPIDVAGNGGPPLFTLASYAEPTVTTPLTAEQIADLLGVDRKAVADEPAEVCSIGLPWLIVRLRTLESLEDAVPDLGLIDRISDQYDAIGITAYCQGARLTDCSVHVRTFAPRVGINEDPVCGSGNAAVAVHVARHSRRASRSFSYKAEQGLEIYRRGVLHLSVERQDSEGLLVRLGGNAVRVLEGELTI